MQASNARFDVLAQRGYQKPVYFVVFGGIATRYSTHRIAGATAEYVAQMEVPSGTGAKIKILKGQAEVEDLNFGMVDRNNKISDLVNTNVMFNRTVTVFMGFATLDESDFLVAFLGHVRAVSFTGTRYKFSCSVLQHIQKTTIFTDLAETELDGDVEFDDAVIDVLDTSDFAATGYLRIGKEMVQYGAKTATQFQSLTRGFNDFGDGAISHSDGDDVEEVSRLTENPVNIGLQIITSTGLGTNGIYDVLTAARGVGLDQAKVDVAGFEEERDEWISGLEHDFFFQKSFEAKKFMEDELWATINAYPRTRSAGEQSLRIYATPLPTETRGQFGESVIRGVPRWDKNYRDLRNRIEVAYDYDPIDDEFDNLFVLDDTDSQAEFGVVKTHRVESKGLRTSSGVDVFIRAFAARLLFRFADPPIRIKSMDLHLKERLIEVGDLAEITHRRLPNETGGKGITGDIYEILDRAVDWESGEVTVEALFTKFTTGGTTGRICVINDDAAPDFADATDDDKLKGYISQNDGLMPDGTEGWLIA